MKGLVSIIDNPSHNINCPSGIGWNDTEDESRLDTGRPFMVEEKAYYFRPGAHITYHATCSGDFAYLYTGKPSQGKYYLNVQKRRLPDFRLMWGSIIVIVHYDSANVYENMLKIQSVQEEVDSVIVELVDEKTGKIILVRAPLHNDFSR